MNKPQIDLTGSKILAVDDVPANLDVLSQALEADGYNVLVATSGETALDLVKRIEPDLILLDVMMPGIDGFETCRRLKAQENTKDIPVIFLTARSELEGVLEGFLAGGIDYISKPFQKEEVLIRIRTHLERTRLAKDLADLNAHLEQKVEERTLQLQQKVREWEGKDRIAQHLLTFHTLQETLALVLEVIADVLDVNKAVVYLMDEGTFKPTAAIGLEASKVLVPEDLLPQIVVLDARQAAFEEMISRRAVIQAGTGDSSFVLIPILRGSDLLGVIEVDQSGEPGDVAEDGILALNSFALQAAVAISDAQIQQNASQWKNQMDDVMNLEDLSEDLDALEQFTSKRDE
jgi:DNA-binding response OmpR family regulator